MMQVQLMTNDMWTDTETVKLEETPTGVKITLVSVTEDPDIVRLIPWHRIYQIVY
jgi:hypothetical protein